jgi:transposase
MRGSDTTIGSLFSYVDIEARIPAQHPLRLIRRIVNDVLVSLDAEFAALYEPTGRESIPPERLLRGSLLQMFYSIRSERQLMEQMDYNLLYRWFVGLGIDDPVWDHSTYSKNRDRLLEADIARKFLKGILEHAEVAPLLSTEHFTVDGTLVNAWASLKSFVPKPDARDEGPPAPPGASGEAPPKEAMPGSDSEESSENPQASDEKAPMQPTDTDRTSRNEEVDFHGTKRSNATHASTTDSEAHLFRKGKGKEARLAYMGHALAENRHGLIVEASLTQATGTAEREAAKHLIHAHAPGSTRRLTLGADKAYDTAGFIADCRTMCVTPHVAQNTAGRSSAIDGRTTRHAGYAVSQRRRKLIEEAFGWAKTIGGLARPMRRGAARMGQAFTFAMAAYDLIRLAKLLAGVA